MSKRAKGLCPVTAANEYRNMRGYQGSDLLDLLVDPAWPKAASEDRRYGMPRWQQQDALHGCKFFPACSH